MSELAKKKCVSCSGDLPALKGVALASMTKKLGGGWRVVKKKQLEKEYKFKDFLGALKFTNRVGKIAEQVQHHPDIFLTWGKVKLNIWTHKVGGLTESDFILAAKIDKART